MNTIDLIGYIATTCGAISLYPEVYKALKTHHLKDVSASMLFIMLTCSIMWLSYAIAINNTILMISPCLNIFSKSALIVLKFHYEKTKKPLLKPKLQFQTISSEREARPIGTALRS